MGIMSNNTRFSMKTVLLVSGIVIFSLGYPHISVADIYRWEDDGGGVHFTDNPANIPAKHKSSRKMILKAPPASGKPSLSTVGSPAPRPASSLPVQSAPEPPGQPEDGDLPGAPDELRAKIAAKERYIEGIDRKRSQILNPLGNRFVSPEDLELYKKYSDELPKDRERLKEISPTP
jgi:hypothetical protein